MQLYIQILKPGRILQSCFYLQGCPGIICQSNYHVSFRVSSSNTGILNENSVYHWAALYRASMLTGIEYIRPWLLSINPFMQAIFQFLVACFFKFGPLYTCFEGICCFFSGIKNADVSNLISNIPLTVVSIRFALQRQSVWLLVKTKRFLVSPETGKTKVKEQQVCCLRSGALPPS